MSEAGKIRIPLSDADVGETETGFVLKAMKDGSISGTGAFIKQFEDGVSLRVGRRHAVATSNATLAIELALRVLGVSRGAEVIVPALTFAAPAMSVLAVDATPVIVDVEPGSWTLSPTAVSEAITASTKAIIAVDVMGHPADYDRLSAFGVPIIEDAAEAHGAMYKTRPVGSLGDISVFSFHANKTITTGEGGCVTTDRSDLADRMRSMVHHGFVPDRPYWHETLGRNFRMTNLTAAVGLGQLQRWDALVAARGRVAGWYDSLLADSGCNSRPIADWATYSCWLYAVTTTHRDRLVADLREAGVDARAVWPALTHQPIFARYADRACPVAERVARDALWLPTYSHMTYEHVAYVADLTRRTIRAYEI
ncbi:aminotransferase DegT [Catellatospora sp. TT07R-123]|uniref:DegT/DnrJ/EryC1/StrS family aminotransferase n=1 Tax=Catellatospora sp. TT07R-123 TaxID=2733863 RepID=UPI001AFE41F7|nr:DegT/DnrJ/EryC1/StrS family aminotransferase [Catellatospora sp. TT07R-123]GHJ45782.1 aminotransferase DegT [Catellatospora sp. TT07R-123]